MFQAALVPVVQSDTRCENEIFFATLGVSGLCCSFLADETTVIRLELLCKVSGEPEGLSWEKF